MSAFVAGSARPFWLLWHVLCLEIRYCGASGFVLFVQDRCGYVGLPCGFRVVFSPSVKDVVGVLMGISLSLEIALGSLAIFTVFRSVNIGGLSSFMCLQFVLSVFCNFQ